MKKLKRNSQGIVDALFDEFDALNAGKSNPQQARAKTSLASTIIASKRLEMDHARFVSEISADPKSGGLKALPMGG